MSISVDVFSSSGENYISGTALFLFNMPLDLPRFVTLKEGYPDGYLMKTLTGPVHLRHSGDSFIVIGPSPLPDSLIIKGPGPDDTFHVPENVLEKIEVCPWYTECALAV